MITHSPGTGWSFDFRQPDFEKSRARQRSIFSSRCRVVGKDDDHILWRVRKRHKRSVCSPCLYNSTVWLSQPGMFERPLLYLHNLTIEWLMTSDILCVVDEPRSESHVPFDYHSGTRGIRAWRTRKCYIHLLDGNSSIFVFSFHSLIVAALLVCFGEFGRLTWRKRELKPNWWRMRWASMSLYWSLWEAIYRNFQNFPLGPSTNSEGKW